MLFQYVGSGKNPPETAVVYGLTFTLFGEAIEVKDPEVIAKLKGNMSFVSEESASDPEGDYAAQLDEEEIFAPDVDVADEPDPIVAPEAEEVPTVPVVTTYAKKRGRPPGPSRT